MKISQWLSEYVGSHNIYDHDLLVKSFVGKTGLEDYARGWPIHDAEETKRAIEARGLGGSLTTKADDLVYGYELAEHFSAVLLDYYPPANGRGTRFRQSVEALKDGGF